AFGGKKPSTILNWNTSAFGQRLKTISVFSATGLIQFNHSRIPTELIDFTPCRSTVIFLNFDVSTEGNSVSSSIKPSKARWRMSPSAFWVLLNSTLLSPLRTRSYRFDDTVLLI